MKRFRVINIIIFLFLLSPIHECYGQTNKRQKTCDYNNGRVSCHTRVKNHSADRVVWSVHEGYTSVHLYKNELDTTIYSKINEILEGYMSSYNSSKYAIEGATAVLAEFQKTMSLLSEKQLDMMLGKYPSKKTVVLINVKLSKGIITKVKYSFFVPAKGILPDSLIILADKKIRTIKFHNLEGFGIDWCSLCLPINKERFTKLCTK